MAHAKSSSLRWPRGSENNDRKPISAGRLLKSAILLAVAYCLLMAGWPVIGKGYAWLFRGGANLLYGSFGKKGVVKFRQSADPVFDTEVTLFNRARRDAAGRIEGVRLPCSTRRCGYIDAAFLASLIIAAPVALRQKVWALLWGQILIHCLAAAKVGLWLADRFSREPLDLFGTSPIWAGKLHVFYELVVLNVTFGLVAAVFIWVLVTFRRQDWAKVGLVKQPPVKPGAKYPVAVPATAKH